jgi:hypothetical protein
MLTANWLASDLCTIAPPDVMYGWHLQAEDARKPPRNYTWPDTYVRQATFLRYTNRCWGTVKVDIEHECCVTSLNIERSFGYQTTTTILVDSLEEDKFIGAAPVAANGALYCGLRAKEYRANSTFGVDRLYVRANGQCISPYGFKCFENSTIAFYDNKKCNGEATSYNLNKERKLINFTRLGELTGAMLEVKSAKSQFSWTAFDRSFDYIPMGNYPSDYFQLLCFMVAFILLFYSMAFHFQRSIATRKFHPIMKTTVQLFWLVHITLKYIALFGLWNYAFDGSTYLFLMLASLGNTMLALYFFFAVNPAWSRYQVSAAAFLVVVHLGLTWTQYTRFRLIDLNGLFTPENVAIFNLCLQIWFLIMYVGDCIPPLSVIYLVVQRSSGSISDGFQELWATNRRVFLVVMLQVCIAILYIIQQNIRENSAILGHDRVWLSFFQVESLIHAMHSVCNIYLITNMVNFVKSATVVVSMQTSLGSGSTNNSSRFKRLN